MANLQRGEEPKVVAHREDIKAQFKAAQQVAKPRAHWPPEAAKAFSEICIEKRDLIPSGKANSWVGHPISDEVGLELFLLTNIAYTSKQMGNKWCNMRELQHKKDLIQTRMFDEPHSAAGHLRLPGQEENESVKYLKLEEENARLNKQLQETLTKVNHLQDLLQKADAIRSTMHNQIMELKKSIRVFCRVRPLLQTEHKQARITFPETWGYIGRCVCLAHSESEYSFTCDRVFDHTASQETIFNEISELVQSALDGHKVCIFAYGQTGSGKTYTMIGEREGDDMGIIPRTLAKIFETIEIRQSYGSNHTVMISMFEVYNDKVQDLLSPLAHNDDLQYVVVKTATEALGYLEKSLKKRSVARTKLNDRSSRSHFIFKLSICSTDKMLEGVVNIIDLAGSERPDSDASRDLQEEAKAINLSLLDLGIVLSKMENGENNISFRGSTLSQILERSLGKDFKTLMLLNVASEEKFASETLATFDFASRIKSCKKTMRIIKANEQKIVLRGKEGFKSPGGWHEKGGPCIKSPSIARNTRKKVMSTANRQGDYNRKRKMYPND
uniref:Kinesin-like protein n=1 Tax=Zea mays subsp. mays TaxID=381124 RepID=A0A7H9SJR7_MAIZE|nr:TR-1 kinesin [Zea mays subsp. mays]